MAEKYMNKKYALGIALSTTRSHPFGKGAFTSSEGAHKIVERVHRKGFSYKLIAAKARAIANLDEINAPMASRKAREVEVIAHALAVAKEEYKYEHGRCKHCGKHHMRY